MTQRNNLRAQDFLTSKLGKRMLIGAAIGLALISFFLWSADYVDPAWGKYWMIRPLIIVPLAGAGGAVFYHLMEPFRYQGGWKKIVATIVSLLVFIIALWLGSVLGLDGTYWN